MSAPFIIPFNNNPSSVIALTSAGYTVPVGKYAKITYRLFSGVLSLDSSIIASNACYNGHVYATATTTSTSNSELTVLTVPSNVSGEMRVVCTANPAGGAVFRLKRSGTILTSFIVASGATDIFFDMIIPSDTITIQQTSGSSSSRIVSLQGMTSGSTTTSPTSKFSDFWANSGSVISLSSPAPILIFGTIELYNQIS